MIFTLCIWSLNIAVSQNTEGFQCENALCLSDHLNETFNNKDVPLSAPLDFSCGITHNNIFFAFSPETDIVTIDVELDNCTGFLGLQAIIYKTQDCKEFQEILCVSPGKSITY